METCRQNREFVSSIGDLVEALYNEVSSLPMSDQAKHAVVMVMLSDTLKRNGHIVSFQMPTTLCGDEAAA